MKYFHKKTLSQIFDRQKQHLGGIPTKRCSENMQQIYRRTPMLKYDFNKVALQLYLKHTLALDPLL